MRVLPAGGKYEGEKSLYVGLLQEAEQVGKLIEQADLQAAVPAQLITVLQGCISCVTVDLTHGILCFQKYTDFTGMAEQHRFWQSNFSMQGAVSWKYSAQEIGQ